MWARCVEILGCSVITTPSTSLVQANAKSTVDTSSTAGAAARTAAGLTSDRTRGFTPDLLLGFTPVWHLLTKANEHDWPSSVCTLMDLLYGSLTHSPVAHV